MINVVIPQYATAASKRRMRAGWLGAILGIWLSGIFAGSIVGHLYSGGAGDSSEWNIFTLVLAILWPMAYFVISPYPFLPSPLRRDSTVSLLIFFLFGLLSLFFSKVMLLSTSYLVLAAMSAWICLQFVSALNVVELEKGFKVYAILTTGFIAGLAAWDYVPGVRLGEGRRVLEPAAIGMVALSAAIAAMAIRLKLVRYGVIAVLLGVIYLTGSRAPAIGTLIGLSIVTYERTRIASVTIKFIVIVLLISGLALILMHPDTAVNTIEGFLGLHDKHRGIDSGGSGRVLVWSETWNLFLDNPVFGVGFRGHEARLLLGTSAHNGYLAMLSEVGIAGFSAIVFLISSGVFRLRRVIRQDKSLAYTHSILLAISCAYLFLAIFERYLINSGNPTSMLFLISILMMSLRNPKGAMESAKSSKAVTVRHQLLIHKRDKCEQY